VLGTPVHAKVCGESFDFAQDKIRSSPA